MEKKDTVKVTSVAIMEFLKSWKFWRPFLGFFIGGMAGFLYYYFIGCTSGSCAITSNPYLSVVWGGLMGFFLVNSPCARGRC
jgi:LytS/YehU family sensor histidine kinase